MGCCFSKEDDRFDATESLLPKTTGKHAEKSVREEFEHIDVAKKKAASSAGALHGGYKSPEPTVAANSHAKVQVVENVDLLGLNKPVAATAKLSAQAPAFQPHAAVPVANAKALSTPLTAKPAASPPKPAPPAKAPSPPKPTTPTKAVSPPKPVSPAKPKPVDAPLPRVVEAPRPVEVTVAHVATPVLEKKLSPAAAAAPLARAKTPDSSRDSVAPQSAASSSSALSESAAGALDDTEVSASAPESGSSSADKAPSTASSSASKKGKKAKKKKGKK